jgi:hypothetical protein
VTRRLDFNFFDRDGLAYFARHYPFGSLTHALEGFSGRS